MTRLFSMAGRPPETSFSDSTGSFGAVMDEANTAAASAAPFGTLHAAHQAGLPAAGSTPEAGAAHGPEEKPAAAPVPNGQTDAGQLPPPVTGGSLPEPGHTLEGNAEGFQGTAPQSDTGGFPFQPADNWLLRKQFTLTAEPFRRLQGYEGAADVSAPSTLPRVPSADVIHADPAAAAAAAAAAAPPVPSTHQDGAGLRADGNPPAATGPAPVSADGRPETVSAASADGSIPPNPAASVPAVATGNPNAVPAATAAMPAAGIPASATQPAAVTGRYPEQTAKAPSLNTPATTARNANPEPNAPGHSAPGTGRNPEATMPPAPEATGQPFAAPPPAGPATTENGGTGQDSGMSTAQGPLKTEPAPAASAASAASAIPAAVQAPAPESTPATPLQGPAPVSAPTGAAQTSPTQQTAPPATPAPVPVQTQLAAPLFSLARASTGEHTMTLAVTPEEFGPVTVRAVISPEGVKMELFASTDAGRDALRSAMTDLRRDLAGQGINASLDLSSRGQPEQQASGRDNTPSREQPAYRTAAREESGPGPEQPAAPDRRMYTNGPTLDVMA